MSETINGFPIIESRRLPSGKGLRPARIILVRREQDGHTDFVTAMHCDGDKGWFHGHYFDVLKDAWDDFISR